MNTGEKVLRYANNEYIENRDMLAVYNAQNQEIVLGGQKTLQAFMNNFVKSCDLEGIRRWEKIFNILADEVTESLDYRKARILSKLAQVPPYTKIFLEQMLTTLFGEGKFTLQILYNTYIIKLDIETDIEGLYADTLKDIRQIVPANMAIVAIRVAKYMYLYLERHYTYEDMEQLTYEELELYEEINNDN